MAINAEVKAKGDESVESLLKRFSKKCKKEDIINEHLDKTSHFKSKKQRRREKLSKSLYLKEKEESKIQEKKKKRLQKSLKY